MKPSKRIIILSFLVLTSCTDYHLPKEIKDNTITYSENMDFSFLSFPTNENPQKEDADENIRNYFLSDASHSSLDSTYILIKKGTIDNKDFKWNVTYDSSKTDHPYYVAVTWSLDKEDDRPNRSFFYSDYLNSLFDFKKESYDVFHIYTYLKDNKDIESSMKISYQDIRYGTSPYIQSVKYSLQESNLPKKKYSDDEYGSMGFETIRSMSGYIDTLLKTINPDYSLW